VNQLEIISLKAILSWYLESGLDETICEEPQNRFFQKPIMSSKIEAALQPEKRTPLHVPGSGVPSVNGDAAVQRAYSLAKEAKTIDELRGALETFDGCPLKKTATNLVFGDGSAEARVVFIGEGPGAEEDMQGLPFIGPSGKLLDQMLASVSIERSKTYIANTVFWRPPGNRSPTTQEIATCMPFVERLIEIIDPEILVAVGGPAATSLLGETQGVGRLRGKWFSYTTARLPAPIQATALFHPAYLLRTPARKREAWRDMLAIKNKLENSFTRS
jgi:uracil-DNA glycosylase family 4